MDDSLPYFGAYAYVSYFLFPRSGCFEGWILMGSEQGHAKRLGDGQRDRVIRESAEAGSGGISDLWWECIWE